MAPPYGGRLRYGDRLRSYLTLLSLLLKRTSRRHADGIARNKRHLVRSLADVFSCSMVVFEAAAAAAAAAASRAM